MKIKQIILALVVLLQAQVFVSCNEDSSDDLQLLIEEQKKKEDQEGDDDGEGDDGENNDGENGDIFSESIKVIKIQNLNAGATDKLVDGQPEPATKFAKFSFKEGKVVEDDSWDIAFLATTIIVNNKESIQLDNHPEKKGSVTGYSVIEGFSDVKNVDEASLSNDSKLGNAISKWYNYNGLSHVVTPIPGMTHVIKTSDGNYAKFVIQSYYKDAPMNPTKEDPARYYTFSYVYKSIAED